MSPYDYKKLLWGAAGVLVAGIGMIISAKKDSVERAEMKDDIRREVLDEILDELSFRKTDEGDS